MTLDQTKRREKRYRQQEHIRYASLQRKWRSNNPRKTLLLNAKQRARKGDLPFDLALETIEWVTHCPVFGVELVYGSRVVSSAAATLDRRDNAKGYVVGNVFVISHRANRLKQDATVQELDQLAAYTRGSLFNR